MGRIAAGRPVEALENPETISLADFTRSKDVYVLQVTGESMQDEHIVNGDYVLVEKTNTARDGEIVVALVNGSDATLKRMFREGDKIRLQPSNSAMAPIVVPAVDGADPGPRDRSVAQVLNRFSGPTPRRRHRSQTKRRGLSRACAKLPTALQVLVERLLDHVARHVADDLLLHLSALEDQQGGNAAHAITLRS